MLGSHDDNLSNFRNFPENVKNEYLVENGTTRHDTKRNDTEQSENDEMIDKLISVPFPVPGLANELNFSVAKYEELKSTLEKTYEIHRIYHFNEN